MYYCNECKAFHDNGLLKEVVEGHGEPHYMETFHVCGLCGSEDFEPADKCPICGELKKEVDDICQGCENALNELSANFVRDVSKYFNINKNTAIDHILRVLEAMQ